MDANKIEKFIDAGYTKAEIELLFKDPKVGPEPVKDPEPAKDPEPTNNYHEEFAAAIKTLTDSVAGLQTTVKAIQEANLKGAATDTAKKDTIADTMKSFIDTL